MRSAKHVALNARYHKRLRNVAVRVVRMMMQHRLHISVQVVRLWRQALASVLRGEHVGQVYRA